jgi:hypothetical protein
MGCGYLVTDRSGSGQRWQTPPLAVVADPSSRGKQPVDRSMTSSTVGLSCLSSSPTSKTVKMGPASASAIRTAEGQNPPTPVPPKLALGNRVGGVNPCRRAQRWTSSTLDAPSGIETSIIRTDGTTSTKCGRVSVGAPREGVSRTCGECGLLLSRLAGLPQIAAGWVGHFLATGSTSACWRKRCEFPSASGTQGFEQQHYPPLGKAN